MAAPSVKRGTQQQREIRLVNEFLATYYPDAQIQTQVPLGPIAPRNEGMFISESELWLLGRFRRRVDAVVFLPDQTIIIEGAIKPNPGDLSIVEFYAELLPFSPEMADRSALPVRKLLVWALKDSALMAFALKRGIEVSIFHPSWIDDYLTTLTPRYRQET